MNGKIVLLLVTELVFSLTGMIAYYSQYGSPRVWIPFKKILLHAKNDTMFINFELDKPYLKIEAIFTLCISLPNNELNIFNNQKF